MTAVTLCAVLFAVESVNAQTRRGYNRAYTKAQVEQKIRRVKKRSDRFVGLFDRALDNNTERAWATLRGN